jgi:hypothetical protein
LRKVGGRRWPGRKRKSFWQALSEMPDVGDDFLFEPERGLPGRATQQPLFLDA